MADVPTTTPKRKRGVETSIAPVAFSFDLSREVALEDGGDSPRSRVVHTFRGLALGSAGDDREDEDGGGATPEYAGESDLSYSYLPANKRIKPDQVMHDVFGNAGVEDESGAPRVPLPEVVAADGPAPQLPRSLQLPGRGDDGDVDGDGVLRRAYPSINRLSESISRAGKKRAGSPPPPSRHEQKKDESSDSDRDNDDEVEAPNLEIVEPIRAALTWREDEITIYDPEDEDDDGIGINGVGFKPTPALAHARVMKRRQQLAEYRKREESEARTKRSQRRRGARPSTPSPEQSQARRKVRFTDGDKLTYITTKS